MDRKLDQSEIKKLLSKLNFEVTDEYLNQLFSKFDSDRSGTIEFEEFI